MKTFDEEKNVESKKPFLFIAILGRPGSGKGTQAELLEKKFELKHISTGALLRKRGEQDDILGKTIKSVLEQGKLIPTPITFMLWMPELEALLKDGGEWQGVLFDGSPRKLHEAQMLDDTLELYGWSDRFCVLNIAISEEESMKRLLKRGRSDDEEQDIRERLNWFKTSVEPVLDHYRAKGKLIDVDGGQSVDAVHEEILSKLGAFLP
ncbi:MAG: nucleoside monophosphate kinase [Candidatus Wildermuthbacteria bacterium]|nr:nucleoside monophosphate kinase [Candidatus Wildermuthbacteria bacterium]